MKSFTIKSLLAAAAMTAAAGVASAQTLKVEVPFSFRAGETLMAPGTYRIVAGTNALHTAAIQIRHDGEGGGIMMLATQRNAAKAWVAMGVPKVQFDCMDGRCSLAKVWNGESRDALEVIPTRRTMQDNASLSTITLTAIKTK